MPKDITKISLYRIIHIDNIEYILRNGMCIKNHSKADPSYINIGDTQLIAQRNDYVVKLDGYGNLGDYVPFYLGPLSPMLLNIKTGYRGIRQHEQSNIVYICCKLDQIIDKCSNWCFTDGHPKAEITEFYNNIDDLDKVDWELVKQRYWHNTEDDHDRMRRKQAEFLVKNYVPVSCIDSIITYDADKCKIIKNIIGSLRLNIEVNINPDNGFYY